MKLIDCICPLCKGSGKIKKEFGSPYSYSQADAAKARRLYATGKTLRNIAEIMGIRHPQTVYNLIHSKRLLKKKN